MRLNRFVNEPDHRAELSGEIYFAGFGGSVRSHSGRFGLFSHVAGRRDAKEILYEAGFMHQGRDYFFAGRSLLKSGRIRDLRREVNTLYVQIHRGVSTDDPVIGAGILYLSRVEFLRMLWSLRVTGMDFISDYIKAYSALGRFFAREIWDSFFRHSRLRY